MELKKMKLTEKRMLICQKLNLKDSDDIFSYYPMRYEQLSAVAYRDFIEGETVTFEGELLTYPSAFRYGKRVVTRFKVSYQDHELLVTIFNRPWMKGFDLGQKLVITGRYDGANKVTATNYYTKPLADLLGITPIYSLKEGIAQHEIRKLIEYTFKKAEIEDHLPSKYIKSHGLIERAEALKNIHFPADTLMLKKALARLKYDEFFRFYAGLEILNRNMRGVSKKAKTFDEKEVETFIASLPFKLTVDQRKAAEEILEDLRGDKAMYRLLQGDVGSGKTAVAEIALYANYLAGYKGVIMAPTGILAKQHYLSLTKAFPSLKIAYLHSGSPKSLRDSLNDYDLIAGTHALFSEDINIEKLGLIITDEQHRFGVEQRRKLKDKSISADFLSMSATPIPRTLASTLYGDLSISTIVSMPSGRKGVKTMLVKENSIDSLDGEIRKLLAKGQQLYVIASMINQNENFNGADATRIYQELRDMYYPYSVSLLHGRMSSEEKDAIMEQFSMGNSQILVSTTVVEVGVNVPNATMMIVFDADRFGLSQLHQLRGRVQRGNELGYCYLLTDSTHQDTLKRLEVLCETTDGFKISYEDLKLRGPGDILGTRQSGVPDLVLGNIFEDFRFIEAAKKDAHDCLSCLDDSENRAFYDIILTESEFNTGD